MLIQKPKRILVAPLDWGLGHTSRCIPVINHLQSLGHTVVFAGNEWQTAFIKESFPGIETTYLPGYEVSYKKKKWLFTINILKQIPSLFRKIAAEHLWLAMVVAQNKIDAIISDNRYGLYHPGIPNVIITHQVQIETGMGGYTNNIICRLHFKYLSRFNEVWVPDVAAQPNLSGSLGHPKHLPAVTRYLGLLSQLEDAIKATDENGLLILLSGPEPQRSMLSDILWEQIKRLKYKVTFVEGTDAVKSRTDIPPHIIYHKRLNRSVLAPLLNKASLVICRSGYSTLMDLVALGKKAILIPTPGQTEQEYLGRRLHKKGIFYCTAQHKLNLDKALNEIETFPFKSLALQNSFTVYKGIIDEWLPKF